MGTIIAQAGQLALALMSADEAREYVTAIRQHLNSARALLLDLYERKGWQALGYDSWRACVVAEFGESQRHLYRQLEAAQVEHVICPNGQIGAIPESHLRPLAPYKDDPEFVRETWEEAKRTAPDGKLTAAHVENVVAKHTDSGRLAVHFSSKTDEHYTPADVIAAVLQCLGTVDLDPCSNSGIPNVPAGQHFTEADDGLSHAWQGRVFMNPPYGLRIIDRWVEKLCTEFESGNVIDAIALVPGRPGSQWWRRFGDCLLCLFDGRLQFIGNETGAPFPSAAFYLGKGTDNFADAFQSLGAIWKRYR